MEHHNRIQSSQISPGCVLEDFLVCISLLEKRFSSFAWVIPSYWEDRKCPNKFGILVSAIMVRIIFIVIFSTSVTFFLLNAIK